MTLNSNVGLFDLNLKEDCAHLSTLARIVYSRNMGFPQSIINAKGNPSKKPFNDSVNDTAYTTKTIATAFSFDYDNGHSQTVVFSCIGSDGWRDWASNFTAFSCNNLDNVSDFVYNDAQQVLAELKKPTNKHFTDNSVVKQIICCGHSRGGAVATYLAYLIKKHFSDINVQVVTWACPGFANELFVTNFNEIFPSDNIKNYIILLDPIRFSHWFMRFPGRIVFLEEENGYWNTWSGMAVGCFRRIIHDFYESISEVLSPNNLIVTFQSMSWADIFIAITSTVILPGVGMIGTLLKGLIKLIAVKFIRKVFGSVHAMESYDTCMHGPLNSLKNTLSDILEDVLTGGKFAIEAIQGFFVNLRNYPSLIYNSIPNFIEMVLNWILSLLSGIGSKILNTFSIQIYQ